MLLLGLLVHQATLLGFPPCLVGLIPMARGACLYSWRVGHRTVCVVDRPMHLMYVFLTRVRVPNRRFGIFSWHKYQCSKPHIPRTHLVRRCPLWLVVTITASVLMAGVPTVMSARHTFAKREWMSPPVGRR
jgi:hypothetical protein